MQLYFLWAHFLLFQFVYWCSHTSFIDNFTYLLVSPSCMCHRFWLHAFFFSFAYFLCWTNPNYCWWKWFFFSFRWLKFYKNFCPVVTKSTSTETILKSLKNILDCFIGFLCKCKDRLGWLISMPLTNITLLAVYQNYCDSCQPFIFFMRMQLILPVRNWSCLLFIWSMTFHAPRAADPGVVQTGIMRELPPCLSWLALSVLRLLNLLQQPDTGVDAVLDAALAPPVSFLFNPIKQLHYK